MEATTRCAHEVALTEVTAGEQVTLARLQKLLKNPDGPVMCVFAELFGIQPGLRLQFESETAISADYGPISLARTDLAADAA
jgi:hypothetical protein